MADEKNVEKYYKKACINLNVCVILLIRPQDGTENEKN